MKKAKIKNNFNDIKQQLEVIEQHLRNEREYSESIIRTIREPLLVLDKELRVITANRSFYNTFKVKKVETEGQQVFKLGNKQWNIPVLKKLLRDILPKKKSFHNYEVAHEFKTIGKKNMVLNAKEMKRNGNKNRLILLAIEDVTERKRLAEEIKTAENVKESNRQLEASEQQLKAFNQQLRAANQQLIASDQRIKESEKRFSDTIRYLDEGYYSCSKEGKVLEHNQAFNRILGFNINNDLKGKKLPDFWQNPDDRKEYLNELMTKGIIRNYLINAKTSSGKKITVMANSHLIKDEKKKLVRIDGTFTDFTARKNAEEAVKDTQKLLFETERLGNVGGWEFDVKTMKQIWTEGVYRIHEVGMDYEPIVSDGIKFYTPASRPIIEKAVQCAIENHEPFDVELQIITAKKNLRWVHAIGKADPENSRVFGFFQDITARKNAEEMLKHSEEKLKVSNQQLKANEQQLRASNQQLRAANQQLRATDMVKAANQQLRAVNQQLNVTQQLMKEAMKELERSNKELEQFAYIASHDLQEPLRMVTSYVQLLEKRYKNKIDKDATDFIYYAVDGAKRMQLLINDLLTYSRLSTKPKHFELVSSAGLLRKVLKNLEIAIQDSKAQITNDELPDVFADEIQFEQLFQNLIGNAIKFRKTDKLPIIHISCKREDNDRVFSIKDNGIGIEKQYYEKIFQIFQRLHLKDEYPGTGIGLAVCKKIVERHKGRIWVESEPKKGSIFNFAIPIVDKMQGKEESL